MPARLSRCRLVLPDEAGIGATPQRCANADSLRSRSGLSPVAASSPPATSAPTPLDGHELRRSLVGQSLDLTVERCDLGRELLVSGGEGLERQLAGRLDPGDLTGTEPRCSDNELRQRQRAQPIP